MHTADSSAKEVGVLQPESTLAQRYRIIRPIKAGGAGQVYEAFDQRLNNRVAIKELILQQMSEAFAREAQLLAHLSHPALPRVIDYFNEDGATFVVMDFIAGPDLSDLMRQHSAPFMPAQVVAWGIQLLEAVEYLHGHNPPILHRDIKPQNIKLATGERIKLLDFGLAKGSPIAQQATLHSVAGYTPDYAPLEQIQGEGTNEQSDLYSVGATLYHLLTHQRPPSALTRASALIREQADPLVLAHQFVATIPPALSAVLQRALALNPQQRFTSAREMQLALQAALNEPDTLVATAPPTHQRPMPPIQPRPAQPIQPPLPLQAMPPAATQHTQKRGLPTWAIVGLTSVLVLVLGGAAFALLMITQDEQAPPVASQTNTPAIIGQNDASPTPRPRATEIPPVTNEPPPATSELPPATFELPPTVAEAEYTPPEISEDALEATLIAEASYGIIVYDLVEDDAIYWYAADEEFPAASLIKVPIALAIYELARDQPALLDQILTLEAQHIVGGTGVLKDSGAGSAYSIRDLVQYMLIESDNTAGNRLIDFFGMQELQTVILEELELSNTSLERIFMDFEAQAAGYENSTTAEDMAQAFQLLHEGYIENDPLLSELWRFLSESNEQPKIANSIPTEYTIIRKAGVLEGIEHDAAIIYHERAPYVLVVLTNDLPTQQAGIDSITTISLQVFIDYLTN